MEVVFVHLYVLLPNTFYKRSLSKSSEIQDLLISYFGYNFRISSCLEFILVKEEPRNKLKIFVLLFKQVILFILEGVCQKNTTLFYKV